MMECAAKPEEDDGFGIDMKSRHEAQNSDVSSPELNNPSRENSKHYPTDIDESIVVDPDALEEDLKKMLMKKFGRHISGLTAEFNRVRKKGKLPDAARRILKDWFNDHCHWPYPSVLPTRLSSITVTVILHQSLSATGTP